MVPARKWLVTEVVQRDGQPVCWCLPVEVKQGTPQTVELAADNAFDLAGAYSAVMGE